jgi:hypothetical protein
MSSLIRALTVTVVCLAVSIAGAAFDDGSQVVGRSVVHFVSQQKTTKKRLKGKTGSAKPEKAEEKEAPAPADGTLKFSRDIAPILKANCLGCHNTAQKKGKLDLSSFEKLMEGTPAEKVIVGGKPEESHLVLRIKGEETPKMPRGGNRSLSEAAITKIERWVRDGALLDAGVDSKAPIEKIAASEEEIRKADLSKLSTEQKDKQVETVGLERWKKAKPKVSPQVIPSAHFLMFGTLSKERASAALKALEAQFTAIKSAMGPGSVEFGEKASLFVFPDAASFGEFVRTQENREVEAGEVGSARFNVPQPFVVVIDPTGDRGETPATAGGSSKKGNRARRENDSEGITRTLNGLLTEYLVTGVASKPGKTPRWLSLGLGAWFAGKVENKSGYVPAIRQQALEMCQLGWPTKATEALGDSARTDEIRAVGYVVIDWLASEARPRLPAFVKGMQEGAEKLDDVIGTVLDGNREMFLTLSADYIMRKYGRP